MALSYLFRVPGHCFIRTGLTVNDVTSRWMPNEASALLLGSLRSVLGSGLLTIRYARRIKAAAYSVVSHTGQVLHATASDQYNTVLLQVMALTTNVRGHLEPVCQPDTADFSQSRIRLLGGGGVNTCADTSPLRAGLQCRYTALGDFTLARLSHKLVNGCHSAFAPSNHLGAEAPR